MNSHLAEYRDRAGIRCPACLVNLDQHRTLGIVRCINPHCREFDRWAVVPVERTAHVEGECV